MKIYCIKLDGMPFCREVLDAAKTVGGILVRQVAGCFTITSLIQMFTGELTSCLEPHGIGYTTWENMKSRDGITRYSWVKKHIQFYLLDKGFSFLSRNQGHLLRACGFGSYPQLCEGTSPYDQNCSTAWKWLIAQGPEWIQSRDDEFAWIDKVQTMKGNIFFNINYSHFHAAVKPDVNEQKRRHQIAGQNVLELVNHYDFSEPDSLFWIYSDHGSWEHPHLNGYPYPQHFYTWAIVKDNSKNPISSLPKVISIQDFALLIKSKFKGSSPDGLSSIFSKERIFLTEDGRQGIAKERLTSALACRFEKWSRGFPLQMTYVIYHELDKRFLQRVGELDDEHFTVKTRDVAELDKELVDSLRNNFSWVPK